MRNAILNRNQTTWTNTDARTSHRAFYEPTHNQPVAIREMGWVGAFNDFMENIGNVEELKPEAGMEDAVTESESLIRGQRIERNSAGNSENSAPLAGRIVKTLIYGGGRNRTRI